MLSPVVVPKPKRLLSPKTGYDLLEEKKQDSGEPSDKMFVFDSLSGRNGEVHEASLEVERILLALEDSEKDQKSPLSPIPKRPTLVESPEYSPPLRPISPPARSKNPQAEAIEAMWSAQEHEIESDECLLPAGHRVFEDFSDGEDEVRAIEDFQASVQRPAHRPPPCHSLTEPSSPYSAPPYLQSRRNSLPGLDDDDIDREDVDIVFISPPHETLVDSAHDDSGVMRNGESPQDEYLPQEPGSCPITVELPGPTTMRRFQSLPGSGPSSNSKRKRGKPKYESRSLPTAVGCDLVLTMNRRTLRTLSATERSA